MSMGLRKAALAFNVLSEKDQKWLLSSLEPSQRSKLVKTLKSGVISKKEVNGLSFRDLLSVYESSDSEPAEKNELGFNDLAFTKQVALVESLSVECIWALSYWDSWSNKEMVLNSLSENKKTKLKAFYKESKSLPSEFLLDSIIEYVSLKAKK